MAWRRGGESAVAAIQTQQVAEVLARTEEGLQAIYTDFGTAHGLELLADNDAMLVNNQHYLGEQASSLAVVSVEQQRGLDPLERILQLDRDVRFKIVKDHAVEAAARGTMQPQYPTLLRDIRPGEALQLRTAMDLTIDCAYTADPHIDWAPQAPKQLIEIAKAVDTTPTATRRLIRDVAEIVNIQQAGYVPAHEVADMVRKYQGTVSSAHPTERATAAELAGLLRERAKQEKRLDVIRTLTELASVLEPSPPSQMITTAGTRKKWLATQLPDAAAIPSIAPSRSSSLRSRSAAVAAVTIGVGTAGTLLTAGPAAASPAPVVSAASPNSLASLTLRTSVPTAPRVSTPSISTPELTTIALQPGTLAIEPLTLPSITSNSVAQVEQITPPVTTPTPGVTSRANQSQTSPETTLSPLTIPSTNPTNFELPAITPAPRRVLGPDIVQLDLNFSPVPPLPKSTRHITPTSPVLTELTPTSPTTSGQSAASFKSAPVEAAPPAIVPLTVNTVGLSLAPLAPTPQPAAANQAPVATDAMATYNQMRDNGAPIDQLFNQFHTAVTSESSQYTDAPFSAAQDALMKQAQTIYAKISARPNTTDAEKATNRQAEDTLVMALMKAQDPTYGTPADINKLMDPDTDFINTVSSIEYASPATFASTGDMNTAAQLNQIDLSTINKLMATAQGAGLTPKERLQYLQQIDPNNPTWTQKLNALNAQPPAPEVTTPTTPKTNQPATPKPATPKAKVTPPHITKHAPHPAETAPSNTKHLSDQQLKIKAAQELSIKGDVWVNRSKLMGWAIEDGFTPIATAGILGNFDIESGANPHRVQAGFGDNSASLPRDILGKAGYGIAQWTYITRQQGLIEFAKARGTSEGDLRTQWLYVMHEISKNPNIKHKMNNAKTTAEATQIWMDMYESPSTPFLAERQHSANKVFNAFTSKLHELQRANKPVAHASTPKSAAKQSTKKNTHDVSSLEKPATGHFSSILRKPDAHGAIGTDSYYSNQINDLNGVDNINGESACLLTSTFDAIATVTQNPDLSIHKIHQGLINSGSYSDADGGLSVDKWVNYVKSQPGLSESTILYERTSPNDDAVMKKIDAALALNQQGKKTVVVAHTSKWVSGLLGLEGASNNDTSGHYLYIHAKSNGKYYVGNVGNWVDNKHGFTKAQIERWIDGAYAITAS